MYVSVGCAVRTSNQQTAYSKWTVVYNKKHTKIKLSNFFSQGGKTFFYKHLYKNTENEDSIKPTMENIVDKN